jgi:hypothetical protein
MRSKYHNKKLTAPDGQKFDSVAEYHRWGCLRLMERAGAIKDLKRQVKFELIPRIGDERACTTLLTSPTWRMVSWWWRM